MSVNVFPYETALQACLANTTPGEKEVIPVDYACCRVAAEDIYAPVDHPPFPHSLVDGYALHIEDIDRLQRKETQLQLSGLIAAGDTDDQPLLAGQTIKIMTGAVLPEGAAAVVKQEEVKEEKGRIFFYQPIQPGDNIQKSGTRIKKGELLVSKGEELGVSEAERIASCGRDQLPVFQIPLVYVINTGSELVLPGNQLLKGQIYVSNKALYFNLLSLARCRPLSGKSPVKDNMDTIISELQKGVETSRLIIISGGTAAGKYDLVLEAFKQIGAEIIFSGLDIKPGRHTSAAVKGGTMMFNLPGTPDAGYILFEILVKPVLRKLRGMQEYQNRWLGVTGNDSGLSTSSQRKMVQGEGEIKKGLFTARALGKNEQSHGSFRLIIDLNPCCPETRCLIID